MPESGTRKLSASQRELFAFLLRKHRGRIDEDGGKTKVPQTWDEGAVQGEAAVAAYRDQMIAHKFMRSKLLPRSEST